VAIPVEVGTRTINNSSSNTTQHLFSHTTTIDTDILIVWIHIEGNEAISGTPQFNSTNMTLIGDTGSTGSNADTRTLCYGIVGQSNVTANVDVNFTSNSNPSAVIAVNYSGVDPVSVAAATNHLFQTKVNLSLQ